METIKKGMAWVRMGTLIVVLAIGVGIGVWFAKNSEADNAPARQQISRSPVLQQTSSDTGNDWDPFRQMERMQEEIDRAIRNATEQFRLSPGVTAFRPEAGYSSSFDLRDRSDHYELRAYLPDAKASDVKVRIDNDQTLHVGVTQRKQETKSADGRTASFTELGHYEQVVTLPEPVKSSEMKIDRHDHEIVVTIPKAKTG
jgi:HSP20 family molecular chaperone IbpA